MSVLRSTTESTGSCALLRSKLGRSAPVGSTDMDGISAHQVLYEDDKVYLSTGKDKVTECLHCNT